MAQQVDRCKGFQGRNIAGTGQHHIRLAILIVACPSPDADAGGAMLDCGVHVQPL